MKAASFKARPIETANDRVERACIARKGVRNRHAASGHCIGSTLNPSSGKLHVVGTIVARLEQGQSPRDDLDETSLRYCKVAGRGSRNVVFIVDTSGSMLPSERLALVKGCVISLLQDAYVKRTRVALIGYGGAKARLLLPFTSSSELAARCIDDMKGGGSTPLLGALTIAASLVERLKGEPAEIILLSDGRYNRSKYGGTAMQIRSFGRFCKRRRVPIHLVDSGSGRKTSHRRVALLASMLGADLRTIESLQLD